MKQIDNECFDAVYINLNFADYCGKRKVLPTAKQNGLAVISREAFMKGELFRMGDEVGFKDRSKLAQIALKWNLSNEEVTTVVVGTSNPDHLLKNLEVLKGVELSNGEKDIIETVKTSSIYKAYELRKTKEFFERN